MSSPARRMLTREEAADYCGFKSPAGFEAHIAVRPIRFGQSVRYDVRDLDEYLDHLREAGPRKSFAELAGNENKGRRA